MNDLRKSGTIMAFMTKCVPEHGLGSWRACTRSKHDCFTGSLPEFIFHR